MILTRLHSLMAEGWADVFAQRRTVERAVEQALALPVCCGRRTISRTICALGRQHQDWSADYKLFSRSKWDETALFRPVVRNYLSRYRQGPIPLALDDTKTPKTGRHIPGASWQRGGGTRRLRLPITAPTPYQASPNGPLYSREPACYLSTDTTSPLEVLAQAAFDRWQIEVNHREEKDLLGVGDAQVRSPRSVERHPAFQVAIYSLLHLAGLLEYGPGRTDDYVPLPKWRRKARRPSLLDLLSLLRKEILETSARTVTIEPLAAANPTRGINGPALGAASTPQILSENVIVSAYT